METVIVCTSGQSLGNPGPASVDICVQNSKGEVVEEFQKAIGNADVNFAEYYAVMLALRTLKDIYQEETNSTHFEFRLNNEFVKKQLNSELPITEPGLVPMFIEIHNQVVADFPNLTWTIALA